MAINLFNSGVEVEKHRAKYYPVRTVRFYLPKVWHILNGLSIESIRINDGVLEVLPEFEFNGSSVVGDTQATLVPALVHDALYSVIQKGHLTIFEKSRLRKSADRIYRALMDLHGSTSCRSWIRYHALRNCGWLFC